MVRPPKCLWLNQHNPQLAPEWPSQPPGRAGRSPKFATTGQRPYGSARLQSHDPHTLIRSNKQPGTSAFSALASGQTHRATQGRWQPHGPSAQLPAHPPFTGRGTCACPVTCCPAAGVAHSWSTATEPSPSPHIWHEGRRRLRQIGLRPAREQLHWFPLSRKPSPSKARAILEPAPALTAGAVPVRTGIQ